MIKDLLAIICSGKLVASVFLMVTLSFKAHIRNNLFKKEVCV